MKNIKRLTVLSLGAGLLLQGCSSLQDPFALSPDQRIDYREAKNTNTLEIPPDLGLSSPREGDRRLVSSDLTRITSLYDYTQQQKQQQNASEDASVLPEFKGIRVEANNNQRWLVVDRPAEKLWGKVRQFVTNAGLVVEKENPQAGLIQTQWAENKAGLDDGWLRNLINRSLGTLSSTSQRDQFRLRLERVTSDQTRIYLTHYGLKETSYGSNGEYHDWVPRPRDSELEAEMLARLMVTLGDSESASRQKLQKTAQIEAQKTIVKREKATNGQEVLVIQAPYDRAWPAIGSILDYGEFRVQNQDYAAGLYQVSWLDEAARTKVSSWKFWNRGESQPVNLKVRLSGQPGSTIIVVTADANDSRSQGGVKKILQTLESGLR